MNMCMRVQWFSVIVAKTLEVQHTGMAGIPHGRVCQSVLLLLTIHALLKPIGM